MNEEQPFSDVDHGAAGKSAQREFDRRHEKRDAAVRKRHPRIGGFLLAAFDDPQSTQAWKKGAEGERIVGEILDGLASQNVRCIHDRQKPGSKANIDHIAISSAGVTVIDAKRYRGLVHLRDVGTWRKPDHRLYVGERDRTKLVTGVTSQVVAVKAVLNDLGHDVPVQGRLCFVEAEWKMFAKPFVVHDIEISGPKSLARLLCQNISPCELDQEQISAIADDLDRVLPPA